MAYQGLLLDAGGVLIRPVGGRWNPRHDFEDIVHRHVREADPLRFPDAFAAGQRVLDGGSATVDLTTYHRAMLRELGVESPSPQLLAELLAPAASPPVEAYPEVRPVLEQLRARGLLMAVVSDSWPELTDLFDELGLSEFFATIVISAVLGCRKPDPRMYRAGSDRLGLAPHECLFVDDDPDLVAAAVALGYGGVTVDRDAAPSASAITSLTGLLSFPGLA